MLRQAKAGFRMVRETPEQTGAFRSRRNNHRTRDRPQSSEEHKSRRSLDPRGGDQDISGLESLVGATGRSPPLVPWPLEQSVGLLQCGSRRGDPAQRHREFRVKGQGLHHGYQVGREPDRARGHHRRRAAESVQQRSAPHHLSEARDSA